MATRQPNAGQTRNQNGRDWGNYASLAVLPNAASWAGGTEPARPLEAGDTAYVTGTGRVHCTSAGTPGGLNATWVATGAGGGITQLTGDVTTALGSGPQAASVVRLQGRAVAAGAPTTNDVLTWDGAQWIGTAPAAPVKRTIDLAFEGLCEGTAPVVVGAVYLESGRTVGASSNALVGTAAGGTGTLQLRRQGTGVLAGISWAYTGTGLSGVALTGGVAVAVPATDWYTIELVGGAGATVALGYGIRIVLT